MWIPGQVIPRETAQLIIAALNDSDVKAELHKQIRIEIDNQREKTSGYRGQVQSYDSLISGNVNMQAKMAASGYDVYGRTIMGSNANTTNQNVYKKMRNQIKYGTAPQEGYYNRGSRSVI